MFSFFANLFLAEFWQLLGTLALSTVIAIAALAVFFLAPSLALKRIALWVAGCAFAFTLVYGWGAHTRDALCTAQVTEMRAKFEKLQDDIKAAALAEMKRLEAELSQKETEIDKWSKDYEALLANSKDAACLLTDDDIRRMQ